MAEKCEFVLEPKAVEFTGLIQSMTGKHQLWELWADFIALTAISCSQQLDFRKEREERYLVIASKYDSEEMNSFSRLFALVMDGYEQNREQDMLGSIYMKLNLGSHWTGQFFTPYRVCQAVSGISSNDAVRLIQEKRVCDNARQRFRRRCNTDFNGKFYSAFACDRRFQS